MDAQRWREVRSLFDELVELEEPERSQRLAALDESDADLCAAVATLLAADTQADERLSDIEAALLDPPLESHDARPRDPFALSGRMLAHFRIIDVLGSGGMGVVYRAEDTRLARPVALKLPLFDAALDDSARLRFLHEARSAAALDHPNLCSIYEVGESEEGHPFLSMPLYAGETLKARLTRTNALSIDEAVDIARQIAEGLAAAHAAGIVHRDVKPGNVMLLPNGTVKILDFGLAKVRDLTLTVSRTQLGTVSYMAPEQIRGERVDGRTDLWALGVVLYEMITGSRPFAGEHDVTVAHAIVHDDPARPSALRTGIPAAIEAILFRLLRKQPAARPATAQEVAAELDAIRHGRSLSTGGPLRQRWMAATAWRRRGIRRTVTAVVITVALLAGALLARPLMRDPVSEPAATEGSIAVLPFENLSGEAEQEYFSDGITEELTSRLARVEGLRVAARTSAFGFRGRPHVDVREVGRALGVATVLGGSVRKEGNRVRINAQLIDASNGYHLWTESFDHELNDVFAVQNQISQAIVTALRIRLARPLAARSPATRNAEAHDLYLKGRYLWNQRTEAALVQATAYFRQAVALDSSYAEAYSGLADVEIAPRMGRPAERFARAKLAAAKALALDSTLAEAHVSMAWIAMWYDRDWSGAERHFLRGMELDPNYAWGVAWYGAYLAAVGRVEESLPFNRRSLELDPLSYVRATHVGTHYVWARRETEAASYFRKALELAPEFYMAHWGLARIHLLHARYADALAELRYDGADYAGLHKPGLLGYTFALAGRAAEARQILADFNEKTRRHEYVPPVDPAVIYIGLGEKDHALDWLERLEADRGARVFLFDPIFDPVRSDPRFQRLLQRLGLPKPSTG